LTTFNTYVVPFRTSTPTLDEKLLKPVLNLQEHVQNPPERVPNPLVHFSNPTELVPNPLETKHLTSCTSQQSPRFVLSTSLSNLLHPEFPEIVDIDSDSNDLDLNSLQPPPDLVRSDCDNNKVLQPQDVLHFGDDTSGASSRQWETSLPLIRHIPVLPVPISRPRRRCTVGRMGGNSASSVYSPDSACEEITQSWSNPVSGRGQTRSPVMQSTNQGPVNQHQLGDASSNMPLLAYSNTSSLVGKLNCCKRL